MSLNILAPMRKAYDQALFMTGYKSAEETRYCKIRPLYPPPPPPPPPPLAKCAGGQFCCHSDANCMILFSITNHGNFDEFTQLRRWLKKSSYLKNEDPPPPLSISLPPSLSLSLSLPLSLYLSPSPSLSISVHFILLYLLHEDLQTCEPRLKSFSNQST